MDPVSHLLLGASAARLGVRRLGPAAFLPGVAGALLPDADTFIRSTADPLLYAEFHRHFTHALAFVPLGGAVASLPWLLMRRTRPRWREHVAAATMGCGTHGLLDACTTYGTRLFWPFSDERVAWNVVAIVDPLFTMVLLVGVLLALWRRSAAPVAAALVIVTLLLGFGLYQRHRASEAQAWIAATRGHPIDRAAVFPSVGTNIVWRSLYASGGTLYMDRIRVPWWGPRTWREGASVAALDTNAFSSSRAATARVRRDVERFRRFAGEWVARAPEAPEVIGDARYSLSLDRYDPVWGVRFRDDADPPTEWVDRSRTRDLDVAALWAELRGTDTRFRVLP